MINSSASLPRRILRLSDRACASLRVVVRVGTEAVLAIVLLRVQRRAVDRVWRPERDERALAPLLGRDDLPRRRSRRRRARVRACVRHCVCHHSASRAPPRRVTTTARGNHHSAPHASPRRVTTTARGGGHRVVVTTARLARHRSASRPQRVRAPVSGIHPARRSTIPPSIARGGAPSASHRAACVRACRRRTLKMQTHDGAAASSSSSTSNRPTTSPSRSTATRRCP